MSDTTQTATGITLPCPHCNEQSACITLHLGDASIECEECGEAIERDQVTEMIERAQRWTRVLAWIDQIPQ